jgi:selenium-dependent xanthine dehydrogenase
MESVSFTLNGQPVILEIQGPVTALAALRDRLGVTTAKDGCSPQGACGCCTVLVDGRPAMSCLRDVRKLDGRSVITIEGLEADKAATLAQAFVETGALQCGYCTPGIVLSAAALLDKDPAPSEARVEAALGPHLCRCTGYKGIVRGVLVAGQRWGEPRPSPALRPGDRYQGRELALGARAFVNDMSRPGMLHGALRLTDHPRARVVALDLRRALAVPGVRRVLTAAELPAARSVGLIRPDWPVYVGRGDLTHCVGSCLASVVADTREAARLAAERIEVTYEVLEPLTDPEEALAEGAPRVHADSPNHVDTCVVARGDVDAALAASAHVLEETFWTQRVEHAFLEPESSLAVPGDDGTMEVFTQGQGVHEDRRQIAAVLGWDPRQVRVTLVPNGGGFGGKEDLTVQHHAALLAQATGSPVKLTLSRDESMRLHPKRHPMRLDYTVGADAQGHLTAVRARIVGDTGGYLSVGGKVLERAAGHSCGPYRVPSVDVRALTVYTNNPSCGAFRGFGANQASFAMEGMMDRLAVRVGVDGYDIRERNLLALGEPFATGQRMDSGVGIRQTLEAVRETFKAHPRAGIACGIKNTGIGNGMADTGRVLIRVLGPRRLSVYTGFTEMGQGLFTVLRGLICRELGVEPEGVEVTTSTEYAVECGMTTASRATMLCTEAALRACEALKQAGGGLSELVGQEFLGEFTCDFTVKPGGGEANPVTHVTFGYATQVVLLDEQGRLEKVVAAHDVGRVMNPVTCRGQIEGGVHMGLGHALTEDLPSTGGLLDSTKLNDLRILRAKDTPEIEVILVEVPDPHTREGVKGVGEIGLVPTSGAVAGALLAFDGIHRVRLPMKGSAAARAILPRRLREDDHA